MRIVFMGTPDYSVRTLEALIKAGHSIEAVFAQPDKKVGRKQILTPPPVKVFASEHNIPVFQPERLKDNEEILKALENINADIIVVVAYGKILPESILNMYKFGCINGHASLLPKYRGASPIQWAIVNGEKQTGVTIMKMDRGMDTGDIIESTKIDIDDCDTADSLFEKLSVVSADLTVKVLKDISEEKAVFTKQDDSLATYAPIIKKEMAHIDFNKSANEVRCAVRGYYSWPCAYFFLNNKRIKALSCTVISGIQEEPGTAVLTDGGLAVACKGGEGVLFDIIQPEGSKAMKSSDWLRGNKINPGEKVG